MLNVKMMCYNRNMIKKSKILFVCALLSCLALPVSALSETQEDVIVKKCSTIQETLKMVQKKDARVRVYLGSLYEKILTKYIVPLNVRLVENNVTNVALIENQNAFVEARILFMDDFVNYQRHLEELTAMSCKTNPQGFYDKLELVRIKREKMTEDVGKMSDLIAKQKALVVNLKENL